MKVICDKYKTCENSKVCDHSEIHDFRTIDEDFFDDCKNSILCESHTQNCNSKSVRKFKLDKLNNSKYVK
jgi:hypothetical protein